MRRIKKIIFINLFYLITFTITFFSFSIGNSIIHNEKKVAEKYVSGKIQNIDIVSSYELKISELKTIVEKYPLSFWVAFSDNESGALVSTEIIKNGFEIIPKLSEGREFYKKEVEEGDNVAIKSSASNYGDEFEILGFGNKRFRSRTIGKYYGLLNEVFIPSKNFYEMIGDDIVTNKPILLWLGGDEEEINKCVMDIKGYLNTLDKKSMVSSIKSNSFIPNTTGNMFSKASLNILIIAFINSMALSSIWIEKRKKELSLRKAIGATDEDLSKLFFKDLTIVLCIASILAMILYAITFKLTNGYIANLNIYPSIESVAMAFILTFGTSYLISLYLIGRLKKVEATEMLRGD